MALEGIKAAALKHLFCFVGEQHSVTVKCNAQFVRMTRGVDEGLRKHPRRRKLRVERGIDLGIVGGQKQMRAKRLEIAKRRRTAREHAALDIEAGIFRGLEYPQA